MVALLGANGAGKTTTLRAISGMVRTQGRITFDGREITNWKPEEVARPVLFMLSEDANYITGECLYVTGGLHMSLGA